MYLWAISIFPIAATVIFLIWFFDRRQPDRLVLIERKGKVTVWKKHFYPRLFCLSLPNTIHSVTTEVKTQARGKIDVTVKLAVTFYIDADHVNRLIRVGGWHVNSLANVEKELTGTIQGIVGEIVEQLDIIEMNRERIAKQVRTKLDSIAENFGLQITAVTIVRSEAVDSRINDAIKMREEARIHEETEKVVQASRIAQAELKSKATQKIAETEHQIAMKNYALRKKQAVEAAELAKEAVRQQSERRQIELETENAEVEMLAKNPALLLLAPQLTRLTEASQQLKNAETVITLSADFLNKLPQPLQQIFGLIQKTEQMSEEKNLATDEHSAASCNDEF